MEEGTRTHGAKGAGPESRMDEAGRGGGARRSNQGRRERMSGVERAIVRERGDGRGVESAAGERGARGSAKSGG